MRTHIMPTLTTGIGDAFKTAVDTYLRNQLRRGIPSLFRDLKKLYLSKDKATIVEKIITGYLTNLRTRSSFVADGDAGMLMLSLLEPQCVVGR
jgi:hypothetical protein